MKKTISLFLILLIIFSFVGCAENQGHRITLGETISVGDFQLTLEGVDFSRIVNNSDGAKPINEYERLRLADGKTLTSLAEQGQIYVIFSFGLKYTGKERSLISPFKTAVLDYDTFKFDLKGAYINKSGTWHELVFQDGLGYSDTLYEFKPMDETVYSCRCYFKASEKILDSSPVILSLQFGEKKSYQVSMEYQKSIPDDTEIRKMANIFGGNDGDGVLNWDEGSFPFFIENRTVFKCLTGTDLANTVLGLWKERLYNRNNPKETDTMEFFSDGTVLYHSVEWTYQTSEDGLTLNRLKNGPFTYEVRQPTDDILVLYGHEGNGFYYPYYLLIRK